MKFTFKPYRHTIADNELLEDLKFVASKLGKTPTQQEYKENGKFSLAPFKKRFGLWAKTLLLAGLVKETTSPGVTREELFLNLEKVWTTLGRQPKSSEMKKPLSKYTRGPYARLFGNWNNALEKFVDTINGSEKNRDESADHSPQIKHETKRAISQKMRFQVLQRDNYRCVSCGISPATVAGTILHVDHIIPWSKNGETVMENLQTLCSACNLGKGNQEPVVRD